MWGHGLVQLLQRFFSLFKAEKVKPQTIKNVFCLLHSPSLFWGVGKVAICLIDSYTWKCIYWNEKKKIIHGFESWNTLFVFTNNSIIHRISVTVRLVYPDRAKQLWFLLLALVAENQKLFLKKRYNYYLYVCIYVAQYKILTFKNLIVKNT